MKRLILIAALALAVAACTASKPASEHGDRHPEPTWDGTTPTVIVDVNIYEWGIDYKSEPFEDGQLVTFNVTNTGVAPHEFEVTGEHAIEQHLSGGHVEHMADGAIKLVLEPGESDSLTVLIDGETNIAACLIPGHYEAGMWISLTDGHGDEHGDEHDA